MTEHNGPTIAELQDEIEQRDQRIKELRKEIRDADEEHTRLRDRLTRMVEHLEEAEHLIENWRETFDMVMTDSGGWTWAPFWQQWQCDIDDYNKLLRNYNELAKRWNSYLPVINGANEKQHRPVGRPLAAEEEQVAQVEKLHQEGRSLRGIAEDTELSFSTAALPSVREPERINMFSLNDGKSEHP